MKNISNSLLILVLVLISSAQAKLQCGVQKHQKYNLFKEEGIKEWVYEEELTLLPDFPMFWTSDLPLPKKNTLFRMLLTNNKDQYQHSYMLPDILETKNGTGIDLTLSNTHKIFATYYLNGKQYPIWDSIGNQVTYTPVWISIFIEKDKFSLYYDNELVSSLKFDNPDENRLDVFSTYKNGFNQNYKLYQAPPKASSEVYKMEVYQDLSESESHCLIYSNQHYNHIQE